MKRKWQKIGLGLAVVLAVASLAAYISHVRTKGAIEEYKAKLGADGEKLAIAELIPPSAPADKNGAEFLREAMDSHPVNDSFFSSNSPSMMRMVAPGKAMVGWRQPCIFDPSYNCGTNTWAEADAVLASHAHELDLLHKLIERPALDFQVDYNAGPMVRLPHLIQLKRAAQFLSYAAVTDLHQGNTALALTNIRAVLAISKGWRDERLLISQLVRIAITQIAITPTWEMLQSPDVADGDLAALQRDWEDIEFIPEAERALEMERAFGEGTLARMRSASDPMRAFGYSSRSGSFTGSGDWLEDIAEFSKFTWNRTRHGAAITMWRYSWSYSDELRALKGEQVLIETARQIVTNGTFGKAISDETNRLAALGFDTSSEFVGWLFDDELDLRNIFSQSVTALGKFLDRVQAVEVARQLTISAIALKRYQLRHGNLPENLSALVPEILSAVPRDPIDGAPMRYQKNSDGTFLLYAIGSDRVDDGGDASSPTSSNSFSWERGRDCVWPQPADESEVRLYLDALAAKKH